jgi:DNA repair protein RecO (recombination protein O)
MLHKTRGIVFRFTKYGDTSIIVNIFTENFGLQSYIVNGVRSKTSKNKIALYQPLTLLELVVYHRENANILRIKEVKCFHPYRTIYQDVRKSTIAIFINEVLNKAVKEQSHAEEIGDFLIRSMIALDELSSVENFHLIFLLKLSHFLGFGPVALNEVQGNWILSKVEGEILGRLIPADYHTPLAVKYEERKNILEVLIRFYKSHIETLGDIRSLEVLKDVLN